jgi:hypothetical protein
MFVWYTIFGSKTDDSRMVKMRLIRLIQKMKLVFTITALLTTLSACVNVSPPDVNLSSQDWQEEFNLANRKLTHTGESRYFILSPGFQAILASQNEQLIITVLDETKEINGISTRIVEEREEKNGELIEISRNFFAIDQETGDVFYFGEEVDIYNQGKIVDHSGAWMAYENGYQPGLIMPGTPEVGMKYYQELAPGIAMDRAEVISISETFKTPAGEFVNCLRTEESSKIQPIAKEYKTYAPGIGLVQDESLTLVSYGYINETNSHR